MSSETDGGSSNVSKRRATFAFMKYSPKTSTPTSMRRTREHAKQIALQLSTNAALSPARDHNDTSQFGFTSESEDLFFSHASASGKGTTVDNPKHKTPAFDLNPLTQTEQTHKRLDLFVEKHRATDSVRENNRPPKFSSPSASSVVSQDTSVSSKNSKARTSKSMPTFPSNSTMQAANVNRRQALNASPKTLDDPSLSPYPLSNSARSFGSTGSAGKSNRLLNYSQTPRPPITPGSGSSSRAGGEGGSTNSTATLSPANSITLFTEGIENGFSFDAFGLDASLVDKEVAAAMKELAGEWGSGVDEFPVQSFDTPTASRSPSPGQMDDDGFEDGFRLTGISGLPLQPRPSPGGSDRSSLSSRSTPWEDKGASRHSLTKQQQAQSQQQPQFVDDGWATFGNSPFGESSFGDPFIPTYAQSEPGVSFTSKIPPIPVLDTSSFPAANTLSHVMTSENASPTASRGAPSNASAPNSDIIIDSDVGVSSDIGVNSNVGEVPMEVVGSKEKKKNLKKGVGEEKKEYEVDIDDESYAEWSVRSPVKQIETWGEDITPLEPDVPQPPAPRSWGQPQEVLQQTQEPRNLNGPTSAGIAGLKRVEKKETSEQELRAKECTQQRTSLESLKARLKAPKVEQPKTYAKSDVGAFRSGATASELSAVLNRVRNGRSFEGDAEFGARGRSQFKGVADLKSKFEKPSINASKYEHIPKRESHDQQQGTYADEFDDFYEEGQSEESYEDGDYEDQQSGDYRGDSPDPASHQSFHQGPLTYRERREMEIQEQQRNFDDPAAEVKPKKLTYREQRELELRKLREEKERQAANEKLKSPPDRDVAALIRKRIATNKHSTVRESEAKSAVENFGNVKNRLKRVSIESKITQFKAPAQEASQPEISVTSPKFAPAASFDSESVQSPRASQSTAVEETRDLVSPEPHDSADIADDVNGESAVKRDAPSPMAAIHEAIASRASAMAAEKQPEAASSRELPVTEAKAESISDSAADTKAQLNAFFANRLLGSRGRDASAEKDDTVSASPSDQKMQANATPAPQVQPPEQTAEEPDLPVMDGRPALKNDPKYDRYFRMLKVGMPMPVVKHAMTRDGVDPSVMDGDHNKPAGYGAGVPLKQDPKYARYFKMLNIGLPMGAVKNAMERDGLDASVMDRDHNLPATVSSVGEPEQGGATREEKKVKDTHRRTRLHWDTARKVRSNSLWAKIDQDEELEGIQIDEDEFQELFQAELTPVDTTKARLVQTKKGAAVRVIDSKRANNGGIILARLKMTHDELADAVDRIDHQGMSPEQMQNIIEYLPTSDERKALEAYMLSGGIDAAEKFDGLCECEKFMVAMMTVKHAKRKVRALLFKLQFQSCLDSLEKDTVVVESACDELINSVRLRKLLGIVLNVGNRLNTAGVSGKRKAGAFSLESLLKLNHAKAFDKKTTFLHYIVLVVQRNNELLLRVKDDLPTVMKAGRVYWDQLEHDLEEVENQLENVRKISLHQARLMTSYRLRKKKKPQETEDDDNSLSDSSMTLEEEVESLRASDIGIFTLGAIKKVSCLRDKVETTKLKFIKLREYFGEEDKQEMQPHEIFNIIATFCRDFDKAKEEVSNDVKKKMREERMVKRTSSDPNLTTQRTPPRANGSNTPHSDGKDQRRSEPLLRASNHQPNIHQGIRTGDRPPLNGQHPSPTMSRSHSVPINVQRASDERPTTGVDGQSRMTNPRPPARPSQNGSHSNSPAAQPPRRPAAPRERNELASPPSGSQMPPSVMRQKAMQRRRRVNAPHSAGDSSVTSTTATLSTYPSSENRHTDAAYTALGRRVGNDTMNQLSPRSAIRQRRRSDQRRQPEEQIVTQWPDEHDDFLQEVDFALD